MSWREGGSTDGVDLSPLNLSGSLGVVRGEGGGGRGGCAAPLTGRNVAGGNKAS